MITGRRDFLSGQPAGEGWRRMIHLETDRLILRDYTENDLEAYFRLKSDAETMYYLQDIQLHSRDEARRELGEVLADRDGAKRKFYFLHM